MTTIAKLIACSRQLEAVSDTARLDAELLLGHVLGRDRTWLITWSDREVAMAAEARFLALLARRAAGEPVAHILGSREFWTLELAVTPATLIPRPDTELLVEQALQLGPDGRGRVLDLGTGTGAIALALATERSAWQVTAVDAWQDAADLAEHNRVRCELDNVRVRCGHWFEPVRGERFDLIVSNPPYLAADDPHLCAGDVRFEPPSALVAGPTGLEDLDFIVEHSPAYLNGGSWLLLEHGESQGSAVRELLAVRGFAAVQSWRDLGSRERVSGGCWPG